MAKRDAVKIKYAADCDRRYEHRCKHCAFLGQYDEYDVYYCPQEHSPTIVARYGNKAEEYQSGLGHTALPALRWGVRRAVEIDFPVTPEAANGQAPDLRTVTRRIEDGFYAGVGQPAFKRDALLALGLADHPKGETLYQLLVDKSHTIGEVWAGLLEWSVLLLVDPPKDEAEPCE